MSEHDQHEPVHEPGHESGPRLDDTGSVSVVRRHGSHSSRRPRRLGGCLPILLVLALIGVGGYFAVTVGIDKVKGQFSGGADDYPGPGSGSVTVEVAEGATVSEIASTLVDLDVVQSSEAFVEAATANPASAGIQPGAYQLRKKMAAADAVALLASGDTRGSQFTFTPGKTVDEIVALLAKDTGIARRQFVAALKNPQALGVPDDAPDAEGYLAAGSYTFFADDSARQILTTMAERAASDAKEADLAAAAEQLGYTEHELVTVASLVEAEGSLLDQEGKSKIARVIYNRLEIPGNLSAGFLNIDATVNFARGEKVARLTTAQIDEVADDPYNTYRQKGLPPGPIGTPGPDALEAATAPADGPWFYYVTVNLATGLTKFAETTDQFNQLRAELDQYCATKSDRC